MHVTIMLIKRTQLHTTTMRDVLLRHLHYTSSGLQTRLPDTIARQVCHDSALDG